MGTVVLYSSVSVDGFIADEKDQAGPLFDWLLSGDVPLDEGGAVKVSQTSYDYTRPYWDQIGVTIVGRHVFDMTDRWDGKPPGGIDHVVVVTHRPHDEWELPGGRVEIGESPEDCVAREITEETQWKVTTGPILDAWMYYIDEVERHVFIVTYGCHPVSDIDPVLSHEHKEIGLFARSEVDDLHMPDGYKRSIGAWFEQVG